MSRTVMRIFLYVTSLGLMVVFPYLATKYTKQDGKWKLTEITLLLSIYALPFYVFFSMSQVGGPSIITVTKVFILITVALWLINDFFLNRELTIFTMPFERATNICSFLWPLGLGLSLFRMEPDKTQLGVVIFFISALPVFLYYLLMLNILKRQVVMRWCLIAIVIGNSFACIGGIYEALTGRAIIARWVMSTADRSGNLSVDKTATGAFRVSSFNVDADLHSQAVVFGLGPLLAFFLLAKKRKYQILLGLMVILFCINGVATGSKAGWIGLISFMLVFVWLMKIPNKTRFVMMAIVLIVLAFAGMEVFTNVAVLEKFTQEGGSGTMSNKYRFADWKCSIIGFLQKPLLGHGFSSSMQSFYKYHRYAPEMVPRWNTAYTGHIASYTVVMTEAGLFGLLVYFGAYFFCFKDLLFIRKHTRDIYWLHMSVGIFAALASNLIMMLFHPTISSETQLLFFVVTSNTIVPLIASLKAENPTLPKPEANWQLVPSS